RTGRDHLVRGPQGGQDQRGRPPAAPVGAVEGLQPVEAGQRPLHLRTGPPHRPACHQLPPRAGAHGVRPRLVRQGALDRGTAVLPHPGEGRRDAGLAGHRPRGRSSLRHLLRRLRPREAHDRGAGPRAGPPPVGDQRGSRRPVDHVL
ncbi:MAG: hypothetical protein AVDCRST_MAG76-890, partial [uncultured Acidimicrobiales bacterium]